MSDFETMEDFVAKVDWEGGVIAAMQYGLFAHDIPDDGSEESVELYRAWEELQATLHLADKIDNILDEYR